MNPPFSDVEVFHSASAACVLEEPLGGGCVDVDADWALHCDAQLVRDVRQDLWLSSLKPELCTGKKFAYFFGVIKLLAYFHKIQPKKTQHV